jgi:dynein heavy chain 1, cytosolic
MASVMDESSDSIITTTTPPPSSTLTDDTTTIIPPFDPTLLAEFLTELAVVILNASRGDLQDSLLSYPDTLQRCSRFATDSNNPALYLRKETGDDSPQHGN